MKSGQPRFLADSMLGSLARKLRLLGIDTLYIKDADDNELKYLVRSQDRCLLTRDTDLSGAPGLQAWLVTGYNVREEFLSIAERLAPFCEQSESFSRCLDCNDLLIPILAGEAEGKVPPYIYQRKETFSSCPSCGKVFWDGTHRKRMSEEISWMKEVLEEERRRGEEGR